MTMMTMKTWMTRALQGAATTVLASGLQAAWAAADLAGGPAKNQLDLHPPVTRIATEVQSLHFFMLIICLVMMAFAFVSNLLYALLGALARRLLAQGRRLLWFNRSMALVLLATAVWMTAA